MHADSSLKLEEFHYDNKLGGMMYTNMKKVHFQGMKGLIVFNKNGDHIGMGKIDRLQGKL